MPFIKFILRTDRKNKKGHHPIYAKVSTNGDQDRAFRSLGFWIAKSSWDDKKETVKSRGGKNDPSYDINKVLHSIRLKAEKVFREDHVKKELARLNQELYRQKTASEYKQIIFGEQNQASPLSVSFLKYYEKYYTELKNKDKYNSYRGHKSAHNKIKEFIASKYPSGQTDLLFSNIDLKLIKSFHEWLIEQNGNSLNSAAKYISRLNSVYNKAIEAEVIPIVENPFSYFSPEKEKTKKVPLYSDEFESIKFLSVEDKELAKYKDYMLFQIYSGGMRVSDLCNLTGANIKNKNRLLDYTSIKTGEQIKMRLVTPAINIISKYSISPGTFVFPILPGCPADYKTDSQLMKEINKATKSINLNYNKISDLAEVDKNVTTHIMRHTFAWMAICAGWSKEEIQRALGHRNLSTTEGYLQNFSNLDIDKKMDQLFESDMKKVG